MSASNLDIWAAEVSCSENVLLKIIFIFFFKNGKHELT